MSRWQLGATLYYFSVSGNVGGKARCASRMLDGGPARAMHLQNRVTPFGDIAISQRGTFTANRGIIHDPMTKTLLTKRWATKTWLICSCAYKGAGEK
jgi:hypothetical protein